MTAAIYRGPTKGYKLTDEDTEWLARSLWGECGACRAGEKLNETQSAAVAWCMIQRFLLLRYKWQWENWTFAGFIRAFSEPVNPTWLPEAPDSRCPAHPEECSEARVAKRRRCQGSRVPEAVMKLAKAFQEGELANPFSEPVYDFRACGSKGAAGRIDIGGNCFYAFRNMSEEDQSKIIPGTVTVEKLPWLFLLLAAGALVYIAWRSWRKE